MPCIVIYVCFVQGRMPLVPYIDLTPMQSLDSTLHVCVSPLDGITRVVLHNCGKKPFA